MLVAYDYKTLVLVGNSLPRCRPMDTRRGVAKSIGSWDSFDDLHGSMNKEAGEPIALISSD